MEESLGTADCLSAIHELVLSHTGLDLARYRAGMVERRIANRMISVGVSSLAAYVDYLRGRHGEASQLIRHISIKVSRFYRNPAAFDCLRDEVIPALRARAPLEIWCIGAARGEEAYTLAMLLEESRVDGTVYATDIDADALDVARSARYGAAALVDLPQALLEAYLHPVHGSEWMVSDAVRRRVQFALHDVTSGAPPAGRGPFHLVCCRNVLIYLNHDGHPAVFDLMRGALAPDAYLFLGEAEWPPAGAAAALRTISSSARLFRRA